MSLKRSLELVTEPTVEPVDLATAKAHCRVPASDTTSDALITAYIEAARKQLEDDTERALMLQTRRESFSHFSNAMPLTGYPLASVTKVDYYSAETALQETVDPAVYEFRTDARPGIVARLPEQQWPQVQAGRVLPVSVTFTAGVADVADVGELAKQAILLVVSHWYEHRTDVVTTQLRTMPRAYEAIATQLQVRPIIAR